MIGAGRSLAIVAPSDVAVAEPERKGGFDTIHRLNLPNGVGTDTLAGHLHAVESASATGAEWLVLLAEHERLSAQALEFATPGLSILDAIFGAAELGEGKGVARLSRLAFDSADRLPHALLNWWMPVSHLVRTATAKAVLDRIAARGEDNWRIHYLFDLWANARCMKSAQPHLLLDHEPEAIDGEARQEVLARLKASPVFLPIVHGDATYFLPYTGLNAGIEREQSRGLFFEADELEELRKLIAPGARIVDVGANTGNHTIFFAGPMRASRVVPIEPTPDAAAALRASVTRNGLSSIDLSLLGIGVSGGDGRMRAVTSQRGGLGATRLEPDPNGPIVVAPLDSVVSEPVDFLKIDVEGMEMDVLAGAKKLIAANRPRIFIEIANANTAIFTAWLRENDYRVARIFTDKGHANYLVVPGEAG